MPDRSDASGRFEAGAPFGPPETWPGILRTHIDMVAGAGLPMALAWGEARALLCNRFWTTLVDPVSADPSGLEGAGVSGPSFDLLEPEIREVFETGRAAAADGRSVWRQERNRRFRRRIDVALSPLRDARGTVVGVLCIADDRMASVDTEHRLRFLVDLGDELRGHTNPVEITVAAAAAIGRHLDVARAGYGIVDPAQEVVSVERDWTRDATVSSIAGEARILDAFGPEIIAELRSGRTLVVEDSDTDPRAGPAYAATWESIGCRALIVVPLLRDGNLRGILFLHEAEPRAWTDAEVVLAQDVAERTSDAYERARTQSESRESEERFRTLANSIEDVFYITDLDRDALLFLSPAYERIWGRPAAELHRDLNSFIETIHPDDRALFLDGKAVQDRGEPIAAEYRIVRPDGEVRWIYDRCFPVPASNGRRAAGIATDITERRAADLARRESEERLQQALSAGQGIGTWDWDVTADFITTDRRFARIYGVELGEAAQGAPIVDFLARIHPADVARVQAAIAAALKTGEVYSQEYRVIQPDGSVRWIAAQGQCKLAGDGTPVRFAGVSFDVSERKKAEALQAALLELSDRLRDVTDPADLAFAACEVLGRALDVSRVGYGIIDARDDTIRIERDWTAPGVLHLEGTLSLRDYGSFVDDLKRGETVVIADADKDPRTAAKAAAMKALSAQAIVNVPILERGGVVALLFINHAGAREWSAGERDLIREVAERTRTAVERRRAEQDLRELAASLERQVEERTVERDRVWRNSRDLLVILEPNGVFRAVNPAWTALLGHSPEEVVGRNILDFVWPEDAESTRAAVEEAASARHLTNFENRCGHRDGTPRWISWRTSAEGDLVFAYGRDVTAEKEQAAILARTEDQLRQSQKMEAIGQLTGGVAHDFNNLLTIIRSSTDLLRRPDLPDERRRRYVDAIADTVDRAAKLTAQLLAFARRQALKPEVFDVSDRVRAVTDLLRTIVGGRIAIATDLPGEPAFVEADVVQFETALVNMAVNARDAMDGEGQLAVAVREVQGLPGVAPSGAFVAISLSDTGVGIAPEHIGKIFEPFFTTKEIGKGTGLGLSQVYGFAKQSGGDLTVESQVGRGTTFTLYLPRVAGTVAEPADDATGPILVSGRGRRVLIVEDNVEVRMFANQVLQDLGFVTACASSAAEALKLLDGGLSVDVVFSDVVMPGMSGVDLGNEIRRRFPGVPVVLASGYADVLAEEGRHGFDLLHKPYAAEQLSRALRRAMRRRAGRPGVA